MGHGQGVGIQGSPAAIEFEKVGSLRYSHYTEFMAEKDLELMCKQYKKHFESNSSDGKSKIVDCFKRKDFDPIPELMTQNSNQKQSFLSQCVEVSMIH